MEYTDVESKTKKRFEKDLKIIVTSDSILYKNKVNDEVSLEAILIESEQKHEDYN